MHETNFTAAWFRSQALFLHAAVWHFSCVAFQLGCISAKVNLIPLNHWAARYDTGLLNVLTPKGVVFSFLFFSFLFFPFLFFSFLFLHFSCKQFLPARDRQQLITMLKWLSSRVHTVALCAHSVQWGCRNSEQASGMCSVCHAAQAVWEETND